MKLDNEFTVGVPIERAWAVLTDLELIAPCMPGAQLTGVNDGVYTGKVKIKVGPVTAEYSGTAQFAEKDEPGYRAVIEARGRDSRGQGNATALISARLRPEGSGTVVNVDTDLTIAGRIAQFGSGMIKEVSANLLRQFVDCLEQKLADLGSGSGGLAAESAGGAPGSASGAAESAGAAAGSAGAAVPATAAAASAAAAAASASAAVTAAEPLNLMSVAGGAIYKRAVPLVVAVVVVLAVIIWLIVR